METDVASNYMRDVIRLKVYDPERFSTLCKMHLSFNLDLENDELSQILETDNFALRSKKTPGFGPLAKRIRGKSANGLMNEAPLTQEGICQVYQLIEYLGRDYNITQEGLFRKSGKLSRQQELKEMLNFGAAVDLDLGQYSVHECASVLKSFLASLPQPLLTEAHYKAHCKVPDMYCEEMNGNQRISTRRKQIKSIQLLFLLMPANNRRLLQDVLILLHRVTKAQKDNLMDSTNLAMMFAPHILCPRKLSGEELQAVSGNATTAVAFMIDNVAELFKVPKELVDDVRGYWTEQESESRKQSTYELLKSKFGLESPAANGIIVNTKIAFCDRTLANDPSNKDSTTLAVAGLYAYVQSMPDCPQKRKFIKQFNKENGYGIDLDHPPAKKPHKRSKTVDDIHFDRFNDWNNGDVDSNFNTIGSHPNKPCNFASQPPKVSPIRINKYERLANTTKLCNSPLAKSILRASRRPKKSARDNEAIVSKLVPVAPPQVAAAKNESVGATVGKYSSPFARTILRASHRFRKADIENQPPIKSQVNPISANVLVNVKNESTKYSSPLARSVLRASRRVKRAVMPSKNRGSVCLELPKENPV